MNERIASLVGGIGCIQVGATSDIEQKEKFDRVDDSVCAVRSALQEGIVAGGVLLLASFAYTLLQHLVLLTHGKDSLLKRIFGKDLKGKISLLLYLIALPTLVPSY